ncbi:uncharacterized protein COLE_04573 [Cutaneotrichosporon oleaginosum]|nr:hypothetical protein COLE_04573 [Cutaneotrichosporon oleaginosum]
MNITSPYGRVPGMRDRHYLDWSKPGKKRAKWELERSKQLMESTRVVDIIGTGDMSLVPISRSLNNVRVLRVRPDNDYVQVYKCHVTAPKMVVFGNVGAPQTVLGDWRTVVPDSVRKLIVNIRYHPVQHGQAQFPVIVELFPPSLPEVVVHIIEPTGISVLPPWDRDRLQRQRWNSISSSLAGILVRTRRRDFRITVVGFRSLYPGWVGQHVDSVSQLETQLLHSVEEDLHQRNPVHAADTDTDNADSAGVAEDKDAWPFSSVAAAMQCIVFATREEYASTLDPHEHMLETIEMLASDTRDPPLKVQRDMWSFPLYLTPPSVTAPVVT